MKAKKVILKVEELTQQILHCDRNTHYFTKEEAELCAYRYVLMQEARPWWKKLIDHGAHKARGVDFWETRDKKGGNASFDAHPYSIDEIPKYDIDYRGLIEYSHKVGKPVPQLTDEEKDLFINGASMTDIRKRCENILLQDQSNT